MSIVSPEQNRYNIAHMWKTRIIALVLLLLGGLLGYWLYSGQDTKPFKLGLDLSGGSYLVYQADVADVRLGEEEEAMESLRDVIERRVNLFGVSEPNVQTEVSRLGEGTSYRLIVELPGVTDLDEAIAMIGQTPLLEFKLEDPNYDPTTVPVTVDDEGNATIDIDPSAAFVDTGLTGRYLNRSTLQFSQGFSQGGSGMAGDPVISLEFDSEGGDLFAQITRDNIGSVLAIFLDGAPISTPVIQSEITGGEAIITGQFTPDEARQLVGRLNSGALPVPISLLSTQTIGPSLGQQAVEAGVMAGVYALIAVGIFLLFWYRLPGLVAVLALGLYTVIMLALFKTVPVTLTAAGMTGFIISLGIAVDGNILIFERMKEELREGRSLHDSLKSGFSRAWASIRDANISSLISAAILFWFGTSLIQGFALTFGLGVLVSMLTAVTATRIMLHAFAGNTAGKVKRILFGTGFQK